MEGASKPAAAGATEKAKAPETAPAPPQAPAKTELEAGTVGRPGSTTLRSLDLHLRGDANESVRIRMSQRGDDLQVRVEAKDARMTDQLRENVGRLVDSLQGKGFDTDIQTRPEQAAEQQSSAGQQQQRRQNQGNPDAEERPSTRPPGSPAVNWSNVFELPQQGESA